MKEPITQEKIIPDILLQRLKSLVMNGADCIQIAESVIQKDKLPLMVVKLEESSEYKHLLAKGQGGEVELQFLKDTWPGGYLLRSSYTQGELYLNRFITMNTEMLSMKQDAAKIGKSSYEVLVTGDTGTGKELIASSMISDRKGSIKAVNCAGLPSELIESELFGYVAGAFTGSNPRGSEGLMQAAEDGVMFLDEVGELPMSMQAKLLRAIQDKKVRKVGSKVEETINCKIVCATNRNIRQMVEGQQFRKDLYARISTLELHITPLDERKEDIIPITESISGGKSFLQKYEKELMEGVFDLGLNVRSLQQLVIRYNVLGRVKI